jgi:O-methyltransferase
MIAPTPEELAEAYKLIRRQPPWNNSPVHLLHHRVLPFVTYAPWLSDSDFQNLMARIGDHTLVDLYRCYELYSLARQCVRVPGDVLEVGVWRGGTGAILGEVFKRESEKLVFLADTFRGVVKAGVRDTSYRGGEHADTSRLIVETLLDSLGLCNCRLLEGIFPEETGAQIIGKISFLHVDVDVYESCRDVVAWAMPRLSPGSMMVFDDYGFGGCEGVTEFCNELRSESGFVFIHNLNGHAIFLKR